MKKSLLGIIIITFLSACGGGGSGSNTGSNTTQQPSTNSATVEFVNSSQRTVYGIYMSPSTSTSWGGNLISGSSIPPSSSQTMLVTAPDCNTDIDISISITAGNPHPEDSSGETTYREFVECGNAYTYIIAP